MAQIASSIKELFSKFGRTAVQGQPARVDFSESPLTFNEANLASVQTQSPSTFTSAPQTSNAVNVAQQSQPASVAVTPPSQAPNQIGTSVISTGIIPLPQTAPTAQLIKEREGIKEYRLNNGMKIILKRDPTAPLVSFRTMFHVGSMHDPADKQGMAHYLEHVVFSGTKSFKKGEIGQVIDLHGGSINAGTSKTCTEYEGTLPPEYLELSLKIQSEFMREANLDPKEIEHERSIVANEIEVYENSPYFKFSDMFAKQLYVQSPKRNQILGSRETISRVDNKSMKEFYDKYYQPNNATLTLVGNFDENEALRLIQSYFGKYPAANHKYKNIFTDPPIVADSKFSHNEEGKQRHLSIGYRLPNYTHPDFLPFYFIRDALAGSVNSRLYKKLHDEKGIVFSIYVGALSNYDDGIFSVDVSAKDDIDLNSILAYVDEEIEDIKKNGLKPEEIQRVIDGMESAEIFKKDGIGGQASTLSSSDHAGDWQMYLDELALLKKITNDDIKRVATKYLDKRVVGNLLPKKINNELKDQSVTADQAKLAQSSTAHARSESVDELSLDSLNRLRKLAHPSSGALKPFEIKLNIEKFSGPNNMQCYLKEDHSLPLIYMTASKFGGGLVDPADKDGLHAMVTSLLFESGTKNHDKFATSDKLRKLGASIRISSNPDMFSLALTAPSKHYDEALKLFNEYLSEPNFKQEELDKIKRDAIASLDRMKDSPEAVAGIEFNRMLYPVGHYLRSKGPLEAKKIIESINLEDVKNHYAKYYRPDDFRIAVVGDISRKDVENKIFPVLSSWHKDAQGVSHPLRAVPAVPVIGHGRKEIVNNSKQQCSVVMGHHIDVKVGDADFYPLSFANEIFGAGGLLTSRLDKLVREKKGFVYGIGSGVDMNYLYGGPFTIGFAANPHNVEEVINLAQKALKELVEKGITQAELDAVKTSRLNGYAKSNFFDREDTCDTLKHWQILNRDETWIQKYRQMISAMTVEQVNAAIRKRIHPEHLTTVIVGPAVPKQNASNTVVKSEIIDINNLYVNK